MRRQHAFELQGHRGARGLKPENTLPSFEAAIDAGASSLETDVHLCADGVPVLFHDDFLNERLCRVVSGQRAPIDFREEPFLSSFTLAELRCFVVDRNPDPRRFADQTHEVTPLAELYAAQANMAPYAIPGVADLLAFVRAYTSPLGERAGKTAAQRQHARKVGVDLELKRVPYVPEVIGDDFTGRGAGILETKVVETVRSFRMTRRVRVRSFDHRAVLAVKRLEPAMSAAVLVSGTALVSPAAVARAARADVYAPDFRFVDPESIRKAHAAGLRVIPWTVNDVKDWEKLLAWNVDGLTTDYPDRLADWLRKHHVAMR